MRTIEKIASQVHVSHDDLVKATLELARDVEFLKDQVASGRVGAKVTEIDPDRIAKTTGQQPAQ